jgi:translation initiation factor 1A
MSDESKYGEFVEVTDQGAGQNPNLTQAQQPAPSRVRMPRKGEVIGVILQRLGGNRMEVLGTDGKTRNCRVPGRYKRSLWLRPKDIVLVQPWPDDDNKADVIFKYDSSAQNQLRKRGMLDSLRRDF